LFDNNKDYEKLKAVITLYEWIIANRDDISKIWENMKKQETRILQTLGFTRAITALSVFLIVVILIIVCAFLMLTIKTKFDAFRKMISIQQLLWTPYFLILSPFLMVISLMTILWFWLSLVLRYGTGALLQSYSSTILWSGLYDILGTSLWFILWLQGLEIVVILICVLVLGYLYLKNLLIEYSN
jgi:cell division protein FtsX